MSPPPSSPDPAPWRVRIGAAAAVLLPVLAAAAVLAPSLSFPFLNLDDDYFVVLNPGLRDLSWDTVAFLFFGDEHDFRYNPLTYLSFAIDHHFSGLDPRAFHRTNLLLHLLNTALVAMLGFRLTGAALAAAVAALLFAIHPLQIEPAVWVMSRNNALFVLFFLLSTLVYLAYRRRRDVSPGRARAALAASVALFALSCLAKTTAVTLPAVLLLIDWLQARGPDARLPALLRRELPSKLAYVPMAMVCTWLLLRASTRSPFSTVRDFEWYEWAAVALHNFAFYLGKAIYPVDLAVLYPIPAPPDGDLPWRFYAASLATLAVAAAPAASFSRCRMLFFALAWYAVTIAPMALLPLLSSDLPILAANRYFYPAAPGVFLLAGVVVEKAWRLAARSAPLRAAIAMVLAPAAVALAVRTRADVQVWDSTIEVLEQAAATQPCDDIFYRLALEYSDAGRRDDAMAALTAAEQAQERVFFTNLFIFQFRISDLYRRAGRPALAARWLQAALEATPNHVEPVSVRCPVGYAYAADLYRRGGDADAAARAETAARQATCDGRPYFESLWWRYAPDAALEFLLQRTAERPDDAEAWSTLASYYERKGASGKAAEARARASSAASTGAP